MKFHLVLRFKITGVPHLCGEIFRDGLCTLFTHPELERKLRVQ